MKDINTIFKATVESIKTVSKLCFICISIYYIVYAPVFVVTWNLFSSFLPIDLLLYLNNTLSRLGTLILLPPLFSVLISFIYTNSRILNWLSFLFGTLGMSFLVLKGLKDGTLNDFMDFRIVQIYNEIVMKEKLHILEQYFMLKFNKEHMDLTRHLFFKDWLELHSLEIRENVKRLPISNIYLYCKEIYVAIDIEYTQLLLSQPKASSWHSLLSIISPKNLFYISFSAVCIYMIFLDKKLWEFTKMAKKIDDFLKQHQDKLENP